MFWVVSLYVTYMLISKICTRVHAAFMTTQEQVTHFGGWGGGKYSIIRPGRNSLESQIPCWGQQCVYLCEKKMNLQIPPNYNGVCLSVVNMLMSWTWTRDPNRVRTHMGCYKEKTALTPLLPETRLIAKGKRHREERCGIGNKDFGSENGEALSNWGGQERLLGRDQSGTGSWSIDRV